MDYFSQKTLFETLGALFINLSSGWFGVLIIGPNLKGVSFLEFLSLLLINLPFGIVSLLFSLWLLEMSKEYE